MTASSLIDRYSLIPKGSAPGVSVGHTCSFIPSEDEGKGRILIVGGANPSGSFSHSHTINLGNAKTICFRLCHQVYNARFRSCVVILFFETMFLFIMTCLKFDFCSLHLDNHEWDIPEWDGLDSRYEHCSFVPQSYPQSLWVFGGAEQSGNRNCVQKLQHIGKLPQHMVQLLKQTSEYLHVTLSYFWPVFVDNICLSVLVCPGSGSDWKTVVVNGEAPSPRTYHTNTACLGDRLYVFCGGEAGAAPVSDLKLHVFDSGLCWFCRCIHSKCITKAFIAIGFLKCILTVTALFRSLFVCFLNWLYEAFSIFVILNHFLFRAFGLRKTPIFKWTPGRVIAALLQLMLIQINKQTINILHCSWSSRSRESLMSQLTQEQHLKCLIIKWDRTFSNSLESPFFIFTA